MLFLYLGQSTLCKCNLTVDSYCKEGLLHDLFMFIESNDRVETFKTSYRTDYQRKISLPKSWHWPFSRCGSFFLFLYPEHIASSSAAYEHFVRTAIKESSFEEVPHNSSLECKEDVHPFITPFFMANMPFHDISNYHVRFAILNHVNMYNLYRTYGVVQEMEPFFSLIILQNLQVHTFLLQTIIPWPVHEVCSTRSEQKQVQIWSRVVRLIIVFVLFLYGHINTSF